ncbi:MAG: ABC transporter permease, partial [Gemmatimonadetes bacterium]|nr:ABC transporter permease [Gemmatimonadota bacterium]
MPLPLIYRAIALWIRFLSYLVPRMARQRWREEWLGELWHGLGARRATNEVLRHSLGAAKDAYLYRASRHSAGPRTPTLPAGRFHGMRHDLLFAARGLRKNPGFAAVAIATLAIGIGTNTAMFSVVRSVLLVPLPFENAGDLVRIWERRPAQGRERNVVSYPDFIDWRNQNTVFEAMAVYRGRPANL